MRVTIATVQSLDGKMTWHDNPEVHTWSSDEDATHFTKLRDEADTIVMGSATYDLMRGVLKPHPGRLRLVMTRNPEKYTADVQPGTLEFTNQSVLDIIARLRSEGRENVLVAGGGQINGEFLNAGVVSDWCATIEPVVFGTGVEMVGGVPADAHLELLESRRLNEQGTLLLHYKVLDAPAIAE